MALPKWTPVERPAAYGADVSPPGRKDRVVGKNVARIRNARTNPKMSQAALAAVAGVSRSTIANLESGYSGNPEYDTVKALAGALGVSPLELYAGAAGSTPVEPLVDALEASPLGAQLAMTAGERSWLRGLGTLDFGGVSPTVQSLYFMVLARRAAV
jgi:transcriptional regulator with XRE-family HTH domain